MSDTEGTTGAAGETTLNLQIEPSIAQGRYASMVMANVGDHECQITFVAQDLLAAAEKTVVGHVVARVYVANDNLRSVADLLTRQADAIDERRKVVAQA